ncbi:MAG: hypothetical protein PWQ10_33 [Patescibacteria group bacterium]|nr:hypothetical protein [Patescibacteria group bacterium]
MKIINENKINPSKGFTTVELLVTLFIAVAFITSGYQLYSLITKDGGEVRAQAQANDVTRDYLQRYKASATNPCTPQTPLTDSPITVDNLANTTISIIISCPYSSNLDTVSKILVTMKYGNSPQKSVSNATYVTVQ